MCQKYGSHGELIVDGFQVPALKGENESSDATEASHAR